jgi:hypothetical protein
MVPFSSWSGGWSGITEGEPRLASPRGQITGSGTLSGTDWSAFAAPEGAGAHLPGQELARADDCVQSHPRPGLRLHTIIGKLNTAAARRACGARSPVGTSRKVCQRQTTCGIDLTRGINPRIWGEIPHEEVIPHVNPGSASASVTVPASGEASGTNGAHAPSATAAAAGAARAAAATITTECAG